MPPAQLYDAVVVGGGIVGTACARQLLKSRPSLRVALLEGEPQLATAQSSHNSGVIHSGIYYTPGSYRARLCVRGASLMRSYALEHQLPHRMIGKLIAAQAGEEERCRVLFDRGVLNGVPDLEYLPDGDALRGMEPECRGSAAIWSPHTGIIDYGAVTRRFAEDFKEAGGEVHLGKKVVSVLTSPGGPHDVKTADGSVFQAGYLITAAGSFADRVAVMTGGVAEPAIVPVRGEYWYLGPHGKAQLKNGHLVYPVPDPSFPWLGVHFTPTLAGEVKVGPNAVFATHRLGYSYKDFSLQDTLQAGMYLGVWRFLARHWKAQLGEFRRSLDRRAYLKALQVYFPRLRLEDLDHTWAGVRALAMRADGTIVDDFAFEQPVPTILNIRNAPSPAATASLAIAEEVVSRVLPGLSSPPLS